LDAFAIVRPGNHGGVQRRRSSLMMNQMGDRREDSSIDWDSEWKKISTDDAAVDEKPSVTTPTRPRGLDDMSELERQTLRASRRVAGLGQQAAKSVESFSKKSTKKLKPKGKVKVPSWKRLSKDWRFWIALLAVVSVGSSVISAISQSGGEDFIV